MNLPVAVALYPGNPVATTRTLPDVARHSARHPRALDRVGMERIHVAVSLEGSDGRVHTVGAEADAYVRLDRAEAKGIHMSRLFLALDQGLEHAPLHPAALADLVERFSDSQQGLSGAAGLRLRFDWMLRRPALRSGYGGWKRHPVELSARFADGEVRVELGVEVVYSSTCPCSAALSRELARDRLVERFGGRDRVAIDEVAAWIASEEGMPATPHSQRSFCDVRVAIDPDLARFPIESLVDRVEGALGTSVQAAVKREDEQAFAELNGSNLMFCEDAARRVAHALDDDRGYRDFRIQVRHEESLHAHDAVSAVAKGVPGGFRVD